MFLKNHPILCITVALLWAVGLVLMFALTGHNYLGMAALGVGALLLFYSLCRDLLPRFPLIKQLRRLVTVVLVICVAYFCVVESFIVSDARTETHTAADIIIVLGAGVRGTVPSLSLSDRLQGTLAYLEAHPDTVAIVSGGQGPGEDITEALCMRDWLVARGIDPQRITMEPESHNTLSNLRNSLALMQTMDLPADPVIGLVSSDYHLHRAKRLAAYVGIDVIGIAAKTSMPTVQANYFIREAFAMTEQYVFGHEGV